MSVVVGGPIRAGVEIGDAASPDYFRLPDPATLFGRRAGRFAALQVELGRLASLLDPGGLVPVGEGIWPACGAPPVASLVVGWPGAQGARYLVGSLRAAAWNHVRIKCAGCASTKGIAYYGIEGRDEVARGETCEACRGYLKHFQQQKDSLVDPVADDVATLGLDLLLREAGRHRLGRNLFLLGT